MSKIVLPTINEQIYQDNWSIDNSYVFRLALISDNKQVKQFCDSIAKAYILDNKSIKKQSKVAYWIKILCINLIFSQISGKSIAISRQKSDYCDDLFDAIPKKNKIHKIWLKYKQVIPILDWMIESKFILQELGNHSKHLRTRIAPTSKFVEQLNSHINISEAYNTIELDEMIEEIVLLTEHDEDNTRQLIKYKDNYLTSYSKNLIKEYNSIINKSILTFKPSSNNSIQYHSKHHSFRIQGTFENDINDINQYSVEEYMVLGHCILRRIFNRGSFENGGRFYARSIGVSFQGITKEERGTILINGNKTVEIDFSAFHINMIKDLNNIYKDSSDCYIACTDEGEIIPRKLVKKILLLGINCKSINSLRLALQQDINDNPKHYIGLDNKWLTGLSSHIQSVLNWNIDIKDFICTDQGTKLMRIDSDITALILEWFTDKGIVCLPIHDSYIVEEQYTEELDQLMKDCYKEVIDERKVKI